jgi:hypothetical protein
MARWFGVCECFVVVLLTNVVFQLMCSTQCQCDDLAVEIFNVE